MKRLIQKIWKLLERVITAVLRAVFRLFGKELTEHTLQQILQFVKFGVVGVLNTAISLSVYYIFVLIRKDFYMIGNVAGFILSVLNAFYWNSKYVFRMQDDRLRTLIRTFIAYGSNLLIGTLMLWLLVEQCGVSHYLAPILNLLITVPLNFLLNKFWVMKKRSGKL